jgi:hypothetical protein
MAKKKNQASDTFRRVPASCYGDGHRPIPCAGEDSDQSIYRNPVGAQSGYELEGQRKGPAEPQREPGTIKRKY